MAGSGPFIPEQLRPEFDRDGFVLLRGFLEPDVVEQARAAMEVLVDRQAERLLAEGKIQDRLADAPFETRLEELYRDRPEEAPTLFRPELHLAGLFPLFFHPGLLDLGEALLGPEIRLYPNYSARPKLPGHVPTEVLWHQDGGYTGAEAGALRMINVWTSLVSARVENGCMQFVPGTHRLGIVRHEQRRYYLEIAPEALAGREGAAIPVETDPGDIVLFHNLLFHRGLPNRSRTVRWSLDWRYQDATQPTQRAEHGHLARSRAHPESVVRDSDDWAARTFG